MEKRIAANGNNFISQHLGTNPRLTLPIYRRCK